MALAVFLGGQMRCCPDLLSRPCAGAIWLALFQRGDIIDNPICAEAVSLLLRGWRISAAELFLPLNLRCILLCHHVCAGGWRSLAISLICQCVPKQLMCFLLLVTPLIRTNSN